MEANIERIVVGFDFSIAARHAVEAAAALAAQRSAELVIVTAVPHLTDAAEARRIIARLGRDASPLELEAIALEEIEQDVRRVVDSLDTAGVPLVFDVGERRPSRMLQYSADDYDAALIAIGAVGREGDFERPVGVETLRLVRESRQPVLVVRRDRPFPPRRILAATDLSGASQPALGWAIDLATTNNVPLEILTVAANRAEADSMTELARELVASMEPSPRLEWNVTARLGTASEVIPIAAAEGGHDLVCLGTLGRSALVELLIGGTSERVLHALPASLLLAKPDTFALRRPKPRL